MSDTQSKYTRRHEVRPNGEEHYVVIGEAGAIHFHVMKSSKETFREKYWGGVEVHSTKQLYDFCEKPTSENCWITGQKCWSDGSTLMARERFIPEWEWCKRDGDFESLWRGLERVYRERFGDVVEAQQQKGGT